METNDESLQLVLFVDELESETMSRWSIHAAREWWHFPLEGFPNEAFLLVSPKEELVLRMRFFEGLSLAQIAEHFHVTPERIRQIEGRALRKLRHPSSKMAIRKQTMVV